MYNMQAEGRLSWLRLVNSMAQLSRTQLLPRFLLSTSAGLLAPLEALRQVLPLWVSHSDMARSSLFLSISRDDHFPRSVPEELHPYFKPKPTAGKKSGTPNVC